MQRPDLLPAPAAPAAPDEVRRLRRDIERRELALERVVAATLALRRRNAVLREENLELRAALERLRRRRAR